jgi:DNA topoisomerase IB
VRLRRSDPAKPGYTRRRSGRGFRYLDRTGQTLTDPAELERIQALVIPPAWRDVWICADSKGHIQAVGIDAAGRRQYRYHDQWRVQRDAAKFDHVLEVGAHLPKVRTLVAEHLRARGYGRERVLAAAVRLLDVGCFRIGGEEYASGEDATFGLATLRREHVAVVRGAVRFCYPAKGGVQRTIDVVDEPVRRVVRGLLRRDSDHAELLAYRAGATWSDVRSADINAYLREISGIDISAKDFRTWNGTVLAATLLATAELKRGKRPAGATVRKRAVSRAMKDVAEYLGNTPTVARASYVDPRVVDLYLDGTTIAAALPDPGADEQETIERAVLEMLEV